MAGFSLSVCTLGQYAKVRITYIVLVSVKGISLLNHGTHGPPFGVAFAFLNDWNRAERTFPVTEILADAGFLIGGNRPKLVVREDKKRRPEGRRIMSVKPDQGVSKNQESYRRP